MGGDGGVVLVPTGSSRRERHSWAAEPCKPIYCLCFSGICFTEGSVAGGFLRNFAVRLGFVHVVDFGNLIISNMHC
jgi:hypothetical protein